MTLIKSISGIRGIIGDGLSPAEIIRFTSAYATYIKVISGKSHLKIVVGRDARISGQMVSAMVCSTLMSCSADVTDLGLATTPTVEMAVTALGADGGIIITASHNPAQWNALKLLNAKGEFLSAADGQKILDLALINEFEYAGYLNIGTYQQDSEQLNHAYQQNPGFTVSKPACYPECRIYCRFRCSEFGRGDCAACFI